MRTASIYRKTINILLLPKPCQTPQGVLLNRLAQTPWCLPKLPQTTHSLFPKPAWSARFRQSSREGASAPLWRSATRLFSSHSGPDPQSRALHPSRHCERASNPCPPAGARIKSLDHPPQLCQYRPWHLGRGFDCHIISKGTGNHEDKVCTSCRDYTCYNHPDCAAVLCAQLPE